MPSLGRLIVSLEGTELSLEEKRIVQHPNTGGILLFSRNYQSVEQAKQLIGQIQSCALAAGRASGLPVFVDQEGGWLQRFKQGLTLLPAPEIYGYVYDQNPQNPEVALKLAQFYGKTMAEELKPFGVISLAPVVDLKRGCPVIEGLGRALHADPEICALLAQAFIEGMQAGGMLATLKHFPGHGHVETDSHQTTPIDRRSKHAIEQDLFVFENLIQKNLAAAIMPAHVLYPAVDAQHIASFSQQWLKTILRGSLGYQGIIVSDCLSMAGSGQMTDLKKVQAALKWMDLAVLSNLPASRLLSVLLALGEDYRQDNTIEKRYTHWTAGSLQARLALAKAYDQISSLPKLSQSSAKSKLMGSQSVLDEDSK